MLRTIAIAVRAQAWSSLLAAVIVISGFTQASLASDGASVKCLLRSEMKNGFLQLTAVASSTLPERGQYQLVVSKHSESGSSENAQSGVFVLIADRERVLTTTLLDSGAIGHYRARLSIETDAGKVSCSSP